MLPHKPAVVGESRNHLQQVLANLVGNAIKFTENGHVGIHVDIAARSSDTEFPILRFEVTDTGIGISPAHIEGIFDSFTQADDGITRRNDGVGLGLAFWLIVRRSF